MEAQPDQADSPMPKRNKQHTDVPTNRHPAHPPRTTTLTVTLGLVLLLNAGLGYWFHDRLITQKEETRLAQLTQEQAERQANAVHRYIKDLEQDLYRFAQRKAFAEAVNNGNDTVIASFKNSIADAFKNMIGMRIITRGNAELDRNHQLPIRFSELDMIHGAEKRQAVKPEVTRIEEQWRLQMVSPLPYVAASEAGENGTSIAPVAGVVLISLQIDDLIDSLNQGDNSLGATELLQVFKLGKPQLLARVGVGNAGPAYELKVPQSHWIVRYTPSPDLRQQAAENLLPFIGIMLACLLVSGVAAYFAARFYQQRWQAQSRESAARRTTGPGTANAPRGGAPAANSIYHEQDILDIDVIDEDEDILGLNEAPATNPGAPAAKTITHSLDATEVVFRDYDVRGIVGEQLTYDLAEQIGQALGSEVIDQGEQAIVVGRDGRTHSPEIADKLIQGILCSGCDVIDIGIVPTPLMNFATHELETTNSGVIVTASHNPAEYNGFKMVVNGQTLAGERIQELRSRIIRNQLHNGMGSLEQQNMVPGYIDRILSDVALAGEIHIVIDAANGVTGAIAPQLFEELGCDVTRLYCDLDGSFPNHDPDPTVEANLQDLIAKVKETGADLGVALDGDGDRVVVVTPQGQIIWPDRLLMLFAKDIVARNPGADVLFDVKCTRQLNGLISGYGGRPIMWKSGHSHMKAKMIQTGALLGGELSGHIFIKDRWYGFDDGMYVAARLLEIMTLRDQDLDTIFNGFPDLPATPELKIPVSEGRKFEIIKTLVSNGDFEDGKQTTIDGLRVDFAEGWGLVRASNTSPALTLRFEGETEDVVKQMQKLFKRELLKVDKALEIGF